MRLSVRKLALVLALTACFACSDNGATAGNPDAAADATLGPLQAVGAPCNSALANPCVASSSGCAAVACLAGVCTVSPLGENASCADVALPMTNDLCDGGAACASGVCGFLVGEGCSVLGVCVTPVDASAALPPACGCDGLPDPYVAVGFTASPASSPVACVDGGADAADGALGDAASADSGGGDGSADASDASDASDAGDDASDASAE